MSALSEEDKKWLTQTLRLAFEAQDQHVKKVVGEAIDKHKKDAITHNPVKAITTGAALVGIIEWLRSLLHR